MIYASVCSGIESATVAWRPLGWRAAFFAEIDPFPCALLAYHYPEIENRGDITLFAEWPDASFDVLVGGTPCQSFSVAGLRKGLDDPRGNLMLTYLAIAKRYRPTWLVWENVPGVLSIDKGRAFGTFLGGLAELGYGWAYRILDAQYFNLAQRRARVFVVGCLRGWQRAAAVLFERSSLRGDSAPSRQTGEEVALPLTCRVDRGGEHREAHGNNLIAFNARQDPDFWNDCIGPLDTDGSTQAIAHALRGEGHDASEDGTGRGVPLYPVYFDETQITSATNRCNPQPGDPCHPLAAGARAPTIAAPWGVRRLTPRECERLQGFPDDYTLIPYRGALAKDGPRYRALGNSKAVPVVRWIGERIQAVEEIVSRRSA